MCKLQTDRPASSDQICVDGWAKEAEKKAEEKQFIIASVLQVLSAFLSWLSLHWNPRWLTWVNKG